MMLLSSSCRRPWRPPVQLPVVATLLALLVLAVWSPGGAWAQAPTAPPGPPPGNGGDLPVAPGTAPSFVPPGSPGAIPGATTGPGLLGNAPVNLNRSRRTFSVPLACQQSGTARVTAKVVSKGPLARTSYACAANRATARLKVSAKVAKQLVRRKVAAATLTVTQAGRASKLYFQLRAGSSAKATTGFWTDGHLQCTDGAGAPQAYLVEPDFTTATPTPVSTRGWVAWYTATGGWHWLGVNGEGAGRWNNWTATVSGIVQFHPNGQPTPVPLTQGPIAVPAAQGVTTVGVYEIVYWVGGKPDYQWQYVNAGTTGAAAAGAGNLYCSY
jgi:hypothetical protein